VIQWNRRFRIKFVKSAPDMVGALLLEHPASFRADRENARVRR
jgi:hypothetical protein